MPRAKRLSPEELAASTVVLHLERETPGFRRKMKAGDVVDPDDSIDRQMLHVSKDLLDPRLLSAIRGEDAAIRRYLNNNSAACSMLARSMWLIPLGLVETVDERVAEYIATRSGLVRVLVREKYAAAKEDARSRLGEHFDDAEYPEPVALEAAFNARARWLSYNVPAALENVKAEIREREMAKLRAEFSTASDEIRAALRQSVADMIGTMADRLGTDDETGKPRTFRDNTIVQMQEFLSTFAARDLTGDSELASLAKQAKKLLDGVEPDELRKNQDVRARVKAGTEAIQAKLAAMDVVPRKARRFAKATEEV